MLNTKLSTPPRPEMMSFPELPVRTSAPSVPSNLPPSVSAVRAVRPTDEVPEDPPPEQAANNNSKLGP